MMDIKFHVLIASILIHGHFSYSQQNHLNIHIKNSAAQEFIQKEKTPVEKYLESQTPSSPPSRKQALLNHNLCGKAFDFVWNIPNEHPKKKQSLLYQICVQAQKQQHKVDLDLADKFFKALEPIYLDNCFIEQALTRENLSWSCRKKRHANKIATCYEFFMMESGRFQYPAKETIHKKQGFTLREMAEDRFTNK